MRIASAVSAYRHESINTFAVYLDSAATTRLDSRVLEAMVSTLSDVRVGNPHATHHAPGAKANQLVESARRNVAAAINCAPEEIVFTSGATEANNLVVHGLACYLRSINKNHIITSAVEHKSVLGPLMALKSRGFTVTVIPVKPCGMIETKEIDKAITDATGLISLQAVNNETGTVQPLEEVADILQGKEILFHSDAAQTLGKKPFSILQNSVDLASLSAHKVHGPQGIGALYVRKKYQKMLSPIHIGGGQEQGLRAGTVPTALCVGFGTACALLENHDRYLQDLRKSFLSQIAHLSPIVYGHKDPQWNVPGILNIRFAGIDNETIVMALPSLAFGTGAACTQSGTSFSHVIKAITGSELASQEALRLSFDRMTTQHEIDQAAIQFIDAIKSIKQL